MTHRRDWHFITCEYPPGVGGVADHTRRLARALAERQQRVHVWCPAERSEPPLDAGVRVHALAAPFTRGGLRKLHDLLDAEPGPRRLFVQWVPHGYSPRSLNVPFCAWVMARARRGDRVELMVHEPFLAFREGSWRQDAAAVVHRAMIAMLLRAATHVWVSIPAWADAVRPYAGRGLPIEWLPVPSNVTPVDDPARVRAARRRCGGELAMRFGHFGTYGDWTRRELRAVTPLLLARVPGAHLLLVGRDSDRFGAELGAALPELAGRIHWTGVLEEPDLSVHLQACDVMLQPFADGASSRRCSLQAALAHGLATVTTVGRLSEPFWTGTQAAAAVPAGDREALVSAAASLAADAGPRARLGAAGRALYDERFTLQGVVATLLSNDLGSA